ncbi:6-phosphogluconolactonase (cycloisomerase 2 family) [Marisediminicola sp. UYEF4]|uniref:lactonase family protein n=1 Tax=Marisediminicola sp. UYEF4 TaxID=1756384 RepID=UPI0033917924
MRATFLTGGYTESSGGHAQGIGLIRPTSDGALMFAGLAASASSPSFLVHGELEGVLYSVDEAGNRVLAFERDMDGPLRTLGWQRSSGTAPCHLSATRDWLYSSNYGTGEIDVFPLGHDGSIGPLYDTVVPGARVPGPHPAQDGPHAHSTLVLGDGVLGDTVLGADLGCDTVGIHRFVDGHLTRVRSIDFPAGTGPRDIAVGPDGRVFVLGELSCVVFELTGLDTDIPRISRSGPSTTSPAPADHAAGLVISPDGRRLYTGLRGSNRIAVLNVDDLTPVAAVDCVGDWPRHLAIDAGTLLVACERSGTVSVLPIDEKTGIPGPGTSIEVPSPTYLLAVGA